jgi:hypothetical protein
MATEQRKLTKDQLIASFEELPESATVEDFIEHLAFVLGVQEGMRNIEAGKNISHEELLKSFRS